VQHPLGWIAEAQARGWDVLLDAAAFVPCHRLDLDRWRPDFVDVSFYKMFGYPTGAGCLLARKPALAKLRRPWFGGGTVAMASVLGDGHHLLPGAPGFEDGTGNFLGLPAVALGLAYLERAGRDAIATRVACLTSWLLGRLRDLRHRNGRPAVRVYGPGDDRERGGTVAMNLLDAQGRVWDCHEVERQAGERRISLRAGCHCNPGAREIALAIDPGALVGHFQGGAAASPDIRAGVLRASLGLVTTFADVQAFLRFLGGFVDRSGPQG
jgi:selenocysteine lyase/cysteine desulfurase